MRWAKSLYRNLRLSLITAAVTLLLLEIGLRIIAQPSVVRLKDERPPQPDYESRELVTLDGTRINPTPGWVKLVHDPYRIYRNAAEQHTDLFNTNSMGFRGPEVSQKKPADVFRIIMVGASGTFGYGASGDVQTIPALLQNKLNEGKSLPQSVEVINAGVIGYLSIQELIYIETELLDLEPDMIILYDGYGDLHPVLMTECCQRPLIVQDEFAFHPYFYVIEEQLVSHLREREFGLLARFGDLLRYAGSKTAIGKLIQQKLPRNASASAATPPNADAATPSENQTSPIKPNPTCVEQTTSIYKKNLTQMTRVIKANRIDLVIAVEPDINWKSPWSKEEEAIFPPDQKNDRPWYPRGLKGIYAHFFEAAKEVATQHQAAIVDLRPALDHRPETLFIDAVHTNDLGNEVMAQALYDAVRKVIRINPRGQEHPHPSGQ